MRAKVVLMARMNDRPNSFPYVAAEVKAGRILFPIEWASKDRRVTQYKQNDVMGFYARYHNNGVNQSKPVGTRVSEPLGRDPMSALTRFLQIDQDFERIQRGLAPINVPTDTKKTFRPERSLVDCVAKWEADLIAEGKKPRTVTDYVGRVKHLLRFFEGRTKMIDDVSDDDLRQFLVWTTKNIKQRKGAGGSFNNTQRNILRDVGILMRRNGVEMPLKTKFWPKEVPKAKRKYSVVSINEMLQAASGERSDRIHFTADDDKDLLLFLLNTGFRAQEAAHAQYKDIDFQRGTINVYNKPEFDWRPKDNESREKDIELSTRFLARMKNRKERLKGKSTDLIFPNRDGRPHKKMIRVIQRLVKRAGLDGKAGMHMIRKTFGTMVANKRGLELARIWLGHEDVQTTQDYLAADELSTKESRALTEEMFSGVGD